MTRMDSLSKNNQSSWRRIRIDPEVPSGLQLLPSDLSSTARFLEMYSLQLQKAGVDSVSSFGVAEFQLNLGCPSGHVVDRGLGCAMMKRTSHVNKHVGLIRKFFPNVPVTLKFRLGMNSAEKEASVFRRLVNEGDADAFIVHARHGRQKSSDPADWSVFRELHDAAEAGKRIIANGDVVSVEGIAELRMRYPFLSGVMIGRMAVQNPCIFSQYREFDRSGTYTAHTLESDLLPVRRKYEEFFSKYYHNDTGDTVSSAAYQKYSSSFMRHFGKHVRRDSSFSLENASG
ncbi:tRNA-specific dihydrouridine synthase [Andalucia godoyi]|nr:tRNA-specific dihydrouridine synthase [Andalucia godoyi]|eukprot:ANDGO_02271.mRNA.1 tRNA-specific dihydrouridine synthase